MSPKRKKPAPTIGVNSPAPPPLSGDPILRTVSRAAFALVMLFALLLLWRGHNAPGGGFIAGLMTVAALLLHRIATGRSALRVPPLTLIPFGVALSVLTGLVPYLLGQPFLKTAYGYITTPLTGEFEWATALIFDIGVYLTVVGSGLSIAENLAEVHPTERVEEDE
ncbi:MnhB domain-containing protein [Deinococcus sp. Leaf326]|jgi:multicomponent Na+:H+ antiporter subunit B|uniref:MnhB domain-containing protein n=1 Tax=Deinococcus sp. Leaf326 TaxID=1736338 RepID=UPI0007023B71|nr:MnhB domain-containing protein [Deinococcus sp. Leaf326]KQR04431.1 cation transporter [Deinococcus sp. Leaf326]